MYAARMAAQEAQAALDEAQALSTQIDERLGQLRANRPNPDWDEQVGAVAALITKRDLATRRARVLYNRAERLAFAARRTA